MPGSGRETYAEPVPPTRAVLTWLLRQRDPLLALGFCAFGEIELFSGVQYQGRPVWTGPLPVLVLVVGLLTLPLAWRRSRPMTASLTIFAVLTASSLAFEGSESTVVFLATLVTVFSGMAYTSRPWLVIAAALVAGVAHNATDPSIHGLADWIWSAGFIMIAMLLGGAVRNRQIRIVSLEQDATELARRHDEQVAEATAAERAAIARELHDIVAHAVSVIVVQAQAGSRALTDQPEVTAQCLDVIETTGRSALSDLRRLLHLLSAESAQVDPSPGLPNLTDLVDRFRQSGLDVRLDLPDPPPALSSAANLAAYRMVQEALTNTMRHSPGATAMVDVQVAGEVLDLSVQDDGTGPSPVEQLGSGRGLIGMRERVALAGGRLVETGPTGAGFRVRAVLPLGAGDLPLRTDDHAAVANKTHRRPTR